MLRLARRAVRGRRARAAAAAGRPFSDEASSKSRPLSINARGQVVIRVQADPGSHEETAFPFGIGEMDALGRYTGR